MRALRTFKHRQRVRLAAVARALAIVCFLSGCLLPKLAEAPQRDAATLSAGESASSQSGAGNSAGDTSERSVPAADATTLAGIMSLQGGAASSTTGGTGGAQSRKPLGSPCTESYECEGEHCVDGVCCQVAECSACQTC